MRFQKFLILFLGIVVPLCTHLNQSMAEDPAVSDIALPPVASTRNILTVTDKDGINSYTQAELEALGLKRLKTTTFWSNDCNTFEGVLLKDLLEDNNMESVEQINITALDDYTTDIPSSDWQNWPVLVATRCDTKPLSIRVKGPTRIVYPKDQYPEKLNKTEERVKWIWAIKSIQLKN